MERKKWCIVFIIVVVLFIICSIGFTFLSSKTLEKKHQEDTVEEDTLKEDTKEEDSNMELSSEKRNTDETIHEQANNVTPFNYDEVEANVLKTVQEHSYQYYLITCEDKRNPNEKDPDFQSTLHEAGTDSFTKIIEKLKSSIRYESNITASFFCPKYDYRIGRAKDDYVEESIFSLNYANDSKVLIVGYQGVGYAFYFEDEVRGFLESLQ